MTRGLYLKSLRIEKGLTQNKAAELIGVHHSTISAYEKDAVNIPSDKLEKLAEIYGVEPGQIMNAGAQLVDVFKALKLTAGRVKRETGISKYDYLPDQLKQLLASAALSALETFYDGIPEK